MPANNHLTFLERQPAGTRITRQFVAETLRTNKHFLAGDALDMLQADTELMPALERYIGKKLQAEPDRPDRPDTWLLVDLDPEPEEKPIRVATIATFRQCTLSDDELQQRVAQHVELMYKTGQLPDRHIPAQPDNDFDLLVGELLIRFDQLKRNQ